MGESSWPAIFRCREALGGLIEASLLVNPFFNDAGKNFMLSSLRCQKFRSGEFLDSSRRESTRPDYPEGPALVHDSGRSLRCRLRKAHV